MSSGAPLGLPDCGIAQHLYPFGRENVTWLPASITNLLFVYSPNVVRHFAPCFIRDGHPV